MIRRIMRSTPDHSAALDEVRAIYAELEKRPLDRQCVARAQCCHFRLTGKTPMLTLGEALLAARGVRAAGRKKLTPHPDGACPMLGRDGRCAIYQHRPFGCRTHFCQAAGGVYPRRHIADLIQRLEALDEKLGGDGPRALEGAVSDALARIG
ncbi:MAG TPA: YkgJ family cysteine cluster protein [Prosthecobacter sp.]|nr:YkgJ family cysteine cluster protein [Prosthecobacter sp.]HRK13526.1 YkgJ family cysteine cluster protein [Prosthecobacter sp.]